MVVLLCLSVDIDGKIWFVSSKEHSLSILIVSFILEFFGFLDVKKSILLLRKVSGNDLVGLVPLVCSHIHLKRFDELAGINIVLLSEIELSNFGVVLRDLLVVWSSDFSRLVCNQLNRSIPLSSIYRGLDSFVKDSSLDISLN